MFYVTEKDHRYLKNEEYREEGGTPAIVESIRAGMVFQLKDAIGVEAILNRENQYTKYDYYLNCLFSNSSLNLIKTCHQLFIKNTQFVHTRQLEGRATSVVLILGKARTNRPLFALQLCVGTSQRLVRHTKSIWLCMRWSVRSVSNGYILRAG